MNPYGINTSESNIRGPLISLDVLYERMPATQGCEKCVEINGEDAFWCCRTMNPSMYYAEFLLAWEQVQNTWGKRRKIGLVVRAIRNYLTMGLSKGCIFFDEDKCNCYQQRPFMCRMYGVIPNESWDKRIGELKERCGEDAEESWRSQCDLVSTVSGKPITPEQEDQWFAHVTKAEERVGVPKPIIQMHDLPGGSYRTFHDHLLLELFSAAAMNKLTEVKLSKPTTEDIDEFAFVLIGELEKAGVL
jgi:Fe-S-cluster containining protein